MEQPRERIENSCRDPHLLSRLCAYEEPSQSLSKIAASDIPNYAMRPWRLRRADALIATAGRKFCTPKHGQPQVRRKSFWCLEDLVGGDLELAPDGDDVSLLAIVLCHWQLARPDRHERTHEDDELTVVHPVAEGDLAHIRHDLSPFCVQRCDNRWALRSHLLPFLIRPERRTSPSSLSTLQSAPDSPIALVPLARRICK